MPERAHEPSADAPGRRPAVAAPQRVPERGPFAHEQIRTLQRRVGNRALARLLAPRARAGSAAAGAAPVGAALLRTPRTRAQRALPDGATYQQLDVHDAALVTVGNRVVAYNLVANPNDANTFRLAFTGLQAVDRAVHAWFRAATAANERLTQSPHYPDVAALAAASEREHERLIAASKDMVNVLPFDTAGMSDEDIAALRTLWQDVVNSRGKIKLAGSAEYKRRVLTELAKMLSTATGRAMLGFLNATPDGEVADSPQSLLTNIYIGEARAALPESVRAASPDVTQPESSKAQPLNVSAVSEDRKIEDLTEVTITPLDPDHLPNPDRFPAIAPDNLVGIRQAMLGGLDGFTHSGKKYAFKRQSGTGAFVTSFPGLAIHGAPGTRHEIYSPGWVTLAHELGHAVNMRAGGTTLKTAGNLADTLTGTANASDIWDNTEELVVISTYENAVRAEAGLSERFGHRPPPWLQVHAATTRRDLKQPLEDLNRADRTWWDDAEWKALFDRCRLLDAKLTLDAGVVQGLRTEVAGLVPAKTAALLPGYLTAISSSQAKADALMAALTTPADQGRAMLFLHRHQDRVADIRALLHYGWSKRKQVATVAARALARRTTFLDLVEGRILLP